MPYASDKAQWNDFFIIRCTLEHLSVSEFFKIIQSINKIIIFQ